MLRTRLLYGFVMIAAVVVVLVVDAGTMPYYPLFWLVTTVVVWQAARETAALLAQLPMPINSWLTQVGAW
jgi:hypothetical protein